MRRACVQALKTCMQVLLNHATANKSSDKTAGSDSDSHSNPFVSLQLLRDLEVPTVIQQADSGSYFALNERIVAAESCWFAAKVRLREFFQKSPNAPHSAPVCAATCPSGAV